MEAVGVEFGLHCLVGGDQTLGDDLPPEDPLLWHEAIADKGEGVGLARRNVLKHFGKAGHGKSLLQMCGRGQPRKKYGEVFACTVVDVIDRLPGVQIHGGVQRTRQQLDYDSRGNLPKLTRLCGLRDVV